jgi:uncharacterized BrkB/YihY/UPF0761 family membrane protein
MPSVLFPRGRIAPPLPSGAPLWRRLVRLVHRLGHGLYVHAAFDAAPSMAFHFFLSLLPLLVFLGYVVALVAKKAGVEAVLGPVLEQLPQASEPIVKAEVERLAGASTLGPLAAVGFLWVAAGGTHGLMNALEVAIGAPRRPWWKKRLLALAWVVGSLVALSGLAYAVVQWDAAVHPPEAVVATAAPPASVEPPVEDTPADEAGHPDPIHPEANARAASTRPTVSHAAAATTTPKLVRRRSLKMLRSGPERTVALVISLALAIAALAGFYRFSISHPRRVKRRTLPGAALAVGLWLLISWAFGLYVRTLSDYAVFYGSLAAVVVLLVWLWLTSLALLVGAELNAQLEGLRD